MHSSDKFNIRKSCNHTFFLGIALATYFLRIQITVLMRGKRDISNNNMGKGGPEIMLGTNNNLYEALQLFQNDAM